MPRRPRRSRLGGSRGVPVLVPVRASPVPSVVRGSLVVRFSVPKLPYIYVFVLFAGADRLKSGCSTFEYGAALARKLSVSTHHGCDTPRCLFRPLRQKAPRMVLARTWREPCKHLRALS